MRYETIIVLAVGIAIGIFVGYLLKAIIAPSEPAELATALQKKLAENPVKYERTIDYASDFLHELKAEAHASSITKEGCVPFKDVRLVLKGTKEGDITYLVNTGTKEEKEIVYVDGTTQVGSYEERRSAVLYETTQKLQEKAGSLAGETKKTAEKLIKKLTEIFSGK